MYTNELKHYGVLGMKWGIRKAHSNSLEISKSGKKSIKGNIKNKLNANKNRNKAIKKLSDEELRRVITRLQMERQYKQLNERQKSIGEKFVRQVVYETAKSTASSYLSKGLNKGINAAVDYIKTHRS